MRYMDKTQIIKLTVCISISILCLSFGNTKQSNTNTSQDDIRQYINGLQSKDSNEREKANKSVREYYAQLNDELIKLVSVKLEPEPSKEVQKKDFSKYYAKELAIVLLGDMRSAKAVPVLMENLEYSNPFSGYLGGASSSLPIGSGNSAAGSLVKIGLPAVELIMEKFSHFGMNDRGSEICCGILKAILGINLAKARIQIDIDGTKDETIKKNLKDVLSFIETRYGAGK